MVKEQFRDAGTHLYPIICGIVISLNNPRSESTGKSDGVQVEMEGVLMKEKNYSSARGEMTVGLDILDKSEKDDEDWDITYEADEFKETEESSDESDLGTYVEVTLE